MTTDDLNRGETPRHPWRRFFARGLDMALYATLFRLFRALALGQRNLNRLEGDVLAVALVAAALALAVEPVLLHFWGTTPGKWVFHLRLTRSDGQNLSYDQALERTAKVLFLGDCLGLPLADLIANLLAYYRDRRGRKQPWEREEELYQDTALGKRHPVLRSVLLYAAWLILMVALLTGAEWRVARLPYPHPQTVAQFSANYDHILRYQSIGYVSPDQFLTDQGAFAETKAEPGAYPVYDLGTPPLLHYDTDAAGRLTGVTLGWDQSSATLWYYPSAYLVRTLQALEGDAALFPSDRSPLYLRCQALAAGDADALHALPSGQWQSRLELELTGCRLDPALGFFVPDAPGQEGQQHVAIRLRLTAVAP